MLRGGGGGEIDALVTFLCRSHLAENLTISVFTLNKIWTRFCEEYSVTAYIEVVYSNNFSSNQVQYRGFHSAEAYQTGYRG